LHGSQALAHTAAGSSSGVSLQFTPSALSLKWNRVILLIMMNAWPDTQKGTRMSKDGGLEKPNLRVPGEGNLPKGIYWRVSPASCEVVEGVILSCLDARFWASPRTLEPFDGQGES
jgi:hypothetical protein